MSIGNMKRRLGRIGIWAIELRFGNPVEIADAAAELDGLGFGSMWIPGGVGGAVLDDVSRLLEATRNAVVATGIINIWKHEPAELGVWWDKLDANLKERILLGLGVSHGPMIGDAYAKPLSTMRNYLEQLSEQGLPAQSLCLAALGPKMQELARDRTAGAHPYLATPEHTAAARNILGPDPILAPEQGVVLESDPDKARAICRKGLEHYRNLPNYRNNWARLGFTEGDINELSDPLIDALFAWGGTDKVAERINAHLTAGADHVCIQVLTGSPSPDIRAAMASWRTLATVLFER